MPDQDTTGVAKPPLDPAEILSKLEAVIKRNQQPAAAGGGSKSWLGTIIILAVVLAAAAIWAWVSWRRNRELAMLRHEKEKARIQADQATMHAQIAKDSLVLAERQKEIDAAQETLRVIAADLRAEEARYEADRRAIDRIRSWDDVPGTR
jgi:uncharacterized protein HemX